MIEIMNQSPEAPGFDGLVRWSVIDGRHRPTGGCRQIVRGELSGPAAGLAICRSGDGAFYLYGCDAEWNVVTDTWHETLEGALRQAELEYEGVTATWHVV